jgi:EF-hand domain
MQVGVPLRALFKALDNDGDGRIDGLELIGGLALCCRGTFEVSHLPATDCHYIILIILPAAAVKEVYSIA